MILLIDNYDSFVFNLARYFAELGVETAVVRNDVLTVEQIRARQPAAIVLSPGPCTPDEAGICNAVIRELGSEIPMLGVCLGHQCLAATLGGRVIRASEPVHGRTSLVEHGGSRLFAGIPSPFRTTRYHSLIAEELSLPAELRVTARTSDGLVMAIEHASQKLFGVQFHPESILTECGHRLLSNFLEIAGLVAGPLPDGDALGEAAAGGDVARTRTGRVEGRDEVADSWQDEIAGRQPLHW